MRRGQRKFDASGTSRLSAMDLGIAVGSGFLVPLVAEIAINRYATNSTMTNNAKMLAGGAGILLAIPIFYWRGLAPAMIGAAMSLVYAASPWITTKVTSLLSGSGTSSVSGSAAMGRLRASRARRGGLGRLQSAPRRQGSAVGAPRMQAANF